MNLRPEQEQALRFLRRRGTDASPESVQKRVSSAFQAVEDLLEEVAEEDARRRPAEGRWSVQEVVDHLIESHRPGIPQLAALLEGRPAGEAIPAGLQSADPLAQSWPKLVSELKAVHRDFLAVLEKGTEETSLEARVPVVLVVKARGENGAAEPIEWIEELDWKAFALGLGYHTREHQAQIAKIFEEDPSKEGFPARR